MRQQVPIQDTLKQGLRVVLVFDHATGEEEHVLI
jgi:hypothetical protein